MVREVARETLECVEVSPGLFCEDFEGIVRLGLVRSKIEFLEELLGRF